MTQEQKKLLGEIRGEAQNLISVGKYVQRGCPTGQAVLNTASERITKLLDALYAAGKCKRVYRNTYEVCNVCGWGFDDRSHNAGNENFCPGCGCEIEATE